MNKNKQYIQTREDYEEIFKDPNVLEYALKIALDTRKFEIELYWKRANYFWGFITVFFAGYTLVYAYTYNKIPFEASLILSCISFLGITFSFGWYLANRGSKYWQENWERHIDYLTSMKQTPIFNYVKTPNEQTFINLGQSFPFSVSKINQYLSLVCSLVWCILFIVALYPFTKKIYNCIFPIENFNYPMFGLVMLIALLFFFLLFCLFIMNHLVSGFYRKEEIEKDFLFKYISKNNLFD